MDMRFSTKGEGTYELVIEVRQREKGCTYRNNRVKTQLSAVTEMSMAAAILVGERKRYAMFL